VGHSKIVALLLIVGLFSGCTSMRWTFQKAVRKEGTVNQTLPDLVWEEYDCETQKRPFFIVEKNELVPPRVKPGGEFNHRMVYVMCPPGPTEVVSGRLSTLIRFKGDPIVQSSEEGHEILPGRWVVDAFVEIPEGAEPGIYAYEVAFSGRGLKFEKVLTFLVKAP
jgi:hypothetical protein